ncbi:MAG: DUF305 domain-containing protein [Comamonadaceae bacterium]|nr:MAG: DUF305 domain-containing protein [Comamonadaceae bacterium]
MKNQPTPSVPKAVRTAAWLLSATLFAPAAWAQHASHGATATKATTPAAAAPSSPAGHGSMDMKAMMKDMNDKMANMPMSGDPDVDFAMMMRVHHIGAIDMAEAQLRDGKNPQMRRMAQEIIAAQNKEIATFDKFLASRGHPQQKPATQKK